MFIQLWYKRESYYYFASNNSTMKCQPQAKFPPCLEDMSSVTVFGSLCLSKILLFLFSCQASYVQPKSCYPNSWLTPEYSDAYFRVSRFYSRTSSFLKIAPEPKQLRCNQQKIITIHYSLNPDAYKDDSHVNFYYLVSLS